MQINFTINIDEKLITKIKGFFKKRNISILVFVVLISGSILYAASEDFKVPFEFADGNIISATQMNTNFETIYTKVASLENTQFAGFESGMIMPYAGKGNKDVPSGWLLCDGGLYSGEEEGYIKLYEAIFETYCNNACGDKEFRVPDLRGRVVVGVNYNTVFGAPEINNSDGRYDNPDGVGNINESSTSWVGSIGQTSGTTRHTLVESEMPKHNHIYTDIYLEKGTGEIVYNATDASMQLKQSVKESDYPMQLKGEDKPHLNVQPYMALRFIIKK